MGRGRRVLSGLRGGGEGSTDDRPHRPARVKGSQLWGAGKEPAKADAAHPDYGKAFMVGRKHGESDYVFLRRRESRLESDGPSRWTGCAGDDSSRIDQANPET